MRQTITRSGLKPNVRDGVGSLDCHIGRRPAHGAFILNDNLLPAPCPVKPDAQGFDPKEARH